MPHLQEAALQDWSFVSFKRVGEKPPQDRCEVANPAAFAEQLQWSRQFWESPHSGSYNQTKVWQPPPSEGRIGYSGGTLDIPRRAHVFSLWSTALEDINHDLVCVKGLLWVQCPRQVPARCCSVASCSFLVATCHKKSNGKVRRERESCQWMEKKQTGKFPGTSPKPTWFGISLPTHSYKLAADNPGVI